MFATQRQLLALLLTAVIGLLAQTNERRTVDCCAAGEASLATISTDNALGVVRAVQPALSVFSSLIEEEGSSFFDQSAIAMGAVSDEPVELLSVEVFSKSAHESARQIETFKLAPKQGPPALSA